MGFDPTAFMGETVATVAAAGDNSVPADPPKETAENRDVWRSSGKTVAAVAAVAELQGDRPFAADLNRLFRHQECARYADEAWRRLMMAIARFADQHAQACLDAGWSARELFAVHRRAFLWNDEPARSRHGLGAFRAPSVCFMVGKREVLSIEEQSIRIVVDRLGTVSTIQRAHNPINHNPLAYGLVWEVPLF